MTWEAVTAVGTLASALVIAITVMLTARQLRLTTRQLDHLRRATQLEGAMAIFRDSVSPELNASQRFIADELPARLTDPEFRSGIELVGRADLSMHKEIALMRFFEVVGAYVKHGLLDGAIIFDVMLPRITGNWEALSEIVAIQRKAITQALWENFEFLYDEGRRWAARHRVYLGDERTDSASPR